MSFSPTIIFSCFYWLVSLCFVVSPSEFQSAGITIQSLFGKWLGSESHDFTFYHIRRTAVTILFHGSLPLGYFIGLTFVGEPDLNFLNLSQWTIHVGWQIYLFCSITLLSICLGIVSYWYLDDWKNHPILKNLTVYADSSSELAMQVNAEFRSIEKYTSGESCKPCVIVTDNWLIKTEAYNVLFVHQDDLRLTVKKTEEYQVSPDAMTTIQYVNLTVNSLKQKNSFVIRILSTEYIDFKAHLRVRIYSLPNVTIHQTSVELFLEVFREQVLKNTRFVVGPNQELGNCIGCDQKPVGVKLLKQCAERDEGECENCKCNPLWCLECMARWYASRQDQARPESWLGGSCTCPMCRAHFCVLDVCCINQTGEG